MNDDLIDLYHETLRFIAINALLVNMDSFLGNGHNYYLFVPRKSRPATFIPWDLNEAFGGHPMAGDNRAQCEMSILSPAPPGNRLVNRLLAQSEIALRYRQICETLLTNVFDSRRMIADAERMDARHARGPGRRSESPQPAGWTAPGWAPRPPWPSHDGSIGDPRRFAERPTVPWTKRPSTQCDGATGLDSASGNQCAGRTCRAQDRSRAQSRSQSQRPAATRRRIGRSR